LNGQRLARGQSAFIPAGTLVNLTTDSDAAVVFRAGTPVPKNNKNILLSYAIFVS
ncbi:MAG: hypothetical protein ICV81_14400, partial [Flavisolibacter sp.]|nr:hypothetical protein [Flavisolibacter sp.]